METQKLIQTSIMLNQGDRVPQFELPDVNGNIVKLSQLIEKGKKVVIVFYRGGWCPLCSKQLASLTANFEKFKEKGVTLVAISNEAPQQGLALLKKLKFPYYLLVDTESKVIESYGVRVAKRESSDKLALTGKHKDYAIPAVFIIGKNGNILWKYVGENYRDRPENSEILTNL